MAGFGVSTAASFGGQEVPLCGHGAGEGRRALRGASADRGPRAFAPRGLLFHTSRGLGWTPIIYCCFFWCSFKASKSGVPQKDTPQWESSAQKASSRKGEHETWYQTCAALNRDGLRRLVSFAQFSHIHLPSSQQAQKQQHVFRLVLFRFL